MRLRDFEEWRKLLVLMARMDEAMQRGVRALIFDGLGNGFGRALGRMIGFGLAA